MSSRLAGFADKGAIAVGTIAIAARLDWLFRFKDSPFYNYYPKGFDQALILRSTMEIVHGNIFGPLSSEKQSALYKYILAIIFAVFGENFTAVWIVQLAIGSATAILVYATAKRAFNPIVGLIAGLWYAIYGPALFTETQILREFLSCFFIILSAYLLVRSDDGGIFKYALAAVLSLSMQNRPNAIIAVPFVVTYLWMRSSEARSKKIKSLAAFVGIFIVASLPMLLRSIAAHGRFVFYDQSGPFAILMGNLPDYPGVGWIPTAEYQRIVTAAGGENAVTWFGAIRELFKSLRNAPLFPFILYAKKIYFLFNNYEYPSNLNYYLAAESSFLLKAPWSRFSPVGALSLAGIAMSLFPNSRKQAAPILWTLAGIFSSVILFYSVDRFRMLLVPLLMILAAFSIHSIIKLFVERKMVKAMLALAMIACLIWASEAVQPLPGKIRPEDYMNIGWAYLENESRRDPLKAERNLMMSWNESVKWSYPLNRVSKLLGSLENLLANNDVNSGKYESAMKRIGRAKISDPCNPANREIEGAAWRAMGMEERAVQSEEEAAKLKSLLTPEANMKIAYDYINKSDLAGAYCHLLSAAMDETDPDKKKVLEEQVSQLFIQLNTTPLK